MLNVCTNFPYRRPVPRPPQSHSPMHRAIFFIIIIYATSAADGANLAWADLPENKKLHGLSMLAIDQFWLLPYNQSNYMYRKKLHGLSMFADRPIRVTAL